MALIRSFQRGARDDVSLGILNGYFALVRTMKYNEMLDGIYAYDKNIGRLAVV